MPNFDDEIKWKRPPFRYEVQYESDGFSATDIFTRPEDVIETLEEEFDSGTETNIIIKKRKNV